ncbi:hypothetical protein [Pedobacter sp. MC2016-24]|uniref:hypothetical protein n=1 Tax=Pedobacter sp. MC2016-24 TaxID=2780090 RepID=UPI00187E6A10|nr:hypothetical protein [Pedobacter sp. MC2016-24]MBE9599838.1 hypothetical protein [Pedobacter sp. MC2016-24]
MKTNFKTGILALALMASVTGVFASDIANAFSGGKFAAYNWQRVDETTQLPTGPIVPGDESNPFPEACNGDKDPICAQGIPQSNPGGGPTLFYHYN